MRTTIGAASILVGIVVAGSVNSAEQSALLACTISEEWLQSMLDASTKAPPPSKEDLREFLAKDGLAEIEASFDAGNEEEFGFGVGTLMGNPMPYFITGHYVMYLTADDEGAQNSVLDRYSGRLLMSVGGAIPIVTYLCEERSRRF